MTKHLKDSFTILYMLHIIQFVNQPSQIDVLKDFHEMMHRNFKGVFESKESKEIGYWQKLHNLFLISLHFVSTLLQ